MRIPEANYRKIQAAMPIPCVDLLVSNSLDEILLLRRNNEPCKDQWWFPGGRVLIGETRETAARRKLLEECGLAPSDISEIGTYDVILPLPSQTAPSHAISTLFSVTVIGSPNVVVDAQSKNFAWMKPDAWLQRTLHPFVEEHLRHALRPPHLAHRSSDE
jgi:colanic acid biosynthesis protein WcaH